MRLFETEGRVSLRCPRRVWPRQLVLAQLPAVPSLEHEEAALPLFEVVLPAWVRLLVQLAERELVDEVRLPLVGEDRVARQQAVLLAEQPVKWLVQQVLLFQESGSGLLSLVE